MAISETLGMLPFTQHRRTRRSGVRLRPVKRPRWLHATGASVGIMVPSSVSAQANRKWLAEASAGRGTRQGSGSTLIEIGLAKHFEGVSLPAAGSKQADFHKPLRGRTLQQSGNIKSAIGMAHAL